jgi:hypothetical protein
MPAIRPLAELSRQIRSSGLPLRGPEDAIGVILAAAPEADPATVVLLLDAHHRGLGAVVVAGTGTDQADDDVFDWVLRLAEIESALGAVVLASVNHGRGYRADPREASWLLTCRDQCASVGIELVDWFLVDDGHVGSRVEQLFVEPLWRDGDGFVNT